MAERQRLSVAVLTKNEEARIARCLESVRWADELVVVDGLSTDRTVEIAQRFGARVVSHPFEGSFATERNLGSAAATGDWVLHLDADDVVTPEFRVLVERLLQRPQPHAAFKFRRKSYLLGHFMRHGGWHHYLPNLVRREAVRYEGIVHERPVLQGTIGRLDADVEHHPCEDLRAFLDRHNRYTTLAAQELVATLGRPPHQTWESSPFGIVWCGGWFDERTIRRRLLRKPWKTWWKSYVKKQGFREGMHGLVFSIFFAGVELIKWAKYWELCRPAGSVPMALAQVIAEQNDETSVKARQLFERQGRVPTRRLVYQLTWQPMKRFWTSSRTPQGHGHGTDELVLALLKAFVHVMFWAKYWELTRVSPGHTPKA